MNNRIYCEKAFKRVLGEYVKKISKTSIRINKIKKVFSDEFK